MAVVFKLFFYDGKYLCKLILQTTKLVKGLKSSVARKYRNKEFHVKDLKLVDFLVYVISKSK